MLLLCNYYVTYKCNAKCEFCNFGDMKRTEEADLDSYMSNVSQLAEMGVRFIDLTGGEPLLNRNIAEMASFARKHKMQTSITTNTLLYKKYAEKLAGNVNLLHFSLDSPNEEEHNKIRGVNCYRSVFDSIEIAKSIGEFPDLLFTVTNDTYKKLPEMYELALKYDLVLIVNPVFSFFGNTGLNEKAVEYVEEFISGKFNVYSNPAFLRLRKAGGNQIQKPACKAVSRVIVISPDNEIILPCYHLANKALPIDRPLRDMRDTVTVKEYMAREGRFDFCQGCTINCYFEPSFAFPTSVYGISAAASKVKYGFHKIIKQKIQKLNNKLHH